MQYRIAAFCIFALGIAAGGAIGISWRASAAREQAVPIKVVDLSAAPTAEAEEATTSAPAAAPGPAATSSVVLPILVYHIVRPSYPDDSAAVKEFAVTPEIFDSEMAWLKSAGYTVVRFSDLENYFDHSAPLPAHPVIISLDDGWSDQFQYAFSILQKYGYPAEFFVFTNGINSKGFMTWDNLKALMAAGMTIGSHTESHPYLTQITDPKKMWAEIDGSKEILETHLGVPVTEFAYPFGMYNATTTAMITQAGYSVARSDSYGIKQSAGERYLLGALNAPITLASFKVHFPATQ